MASLTASQTRHVKAAEQHVKEAKRCSQRLSRSGAKTTSWPGPSTPKLRRRIGLPSSRARPWLYLSAVDCAVKSGQALKWPNADLLRRCCARTRTRRRNGVRLIIRGITACFLHGGLHWCHRRCAKGSLNLSKIDPVAGHISVRETIEQLQNVGKGMYTLEMYRNAVALAIRCERWAMARDMTAAAISGFVGLTPTLCSF